MKILLAVVSIITLYLIIRRTDITLLTGRF